MQLDEMIHLDYVGDFGRFPAGTRLERTVVKCPIDGKGGQSVTIDVDGRVHEVKIPQGAKPGRDFEVAIPVPINSLDSEEENEDDMMSDDDSEDVVAGGAVANQRGTTVL